MPTIFKTVEKSLLLIPVFSTKFVTCEITSAKESTQNISITVEPIILINTATSGFNGLTIVYVTSVNKPIPIILKSSLKRDFSL